MQRSDEIHIKITEKTGVTGVMRRIEIDRREAGTEITEVVDAIIPGEMMRSRMTKGSTRDHH